MPRPDLEVAQIFCHHGPDYRKNQCLSPGQHKAMRDIERCRTARLGGHVDVCSQGCGYLAISYNSCRNRHCPKCQTLAKERWLAARRAELLPVPYYHLVFTLPHELNALAQGNPRRLYAMLFAAASEPLVDFGLGIIAARIEKGTGHRHEHGVLAPVRTYESPIDRRFEEAGFESIATVTLLLKETLVRVAEPALVPAGVR